MLRKIYYKLPPALRLLARKLYYLPADIKQSFVGSKELVPPKGLIYTGSGDFIAVGQRYLEYFITYADLKPDHHVLDVGSGIGRMAVALATYLKPSARYDGFDVMKQGVRWCQSNITPVYPNFQFRHVEVVNDLYTQHGKDGRNFQFPYLDHSYDLVIVISVFTHMVRDEVENYLSEIHRTLKNNGMVFATFFLLNEIARITMKQQDFRFDHVAKGCYLMDPSVKSANVAYDEDELEMVFDQLGFSVKHKFYGRWSGRSGDTLDFQDILVLQKKSRPVMDQLLKLSALHEAVQ